MSKFEVAAMRATDDSTNQPDHRAQKKAGPAEAAKVDQADTAGATADNEAVARGDGDVQASARERRDESTEGAGTNGTIEEPSADPWDREDESAVQSFFQRFEFHGDFHADGMAIGGTSSPRAERIRSSGLSEIETISPDDVSAYRTTDLADAEEQLRRDHLLVLVGPQRTGKKYSALSLLGAVHEDGKAFGISPVVVPSKILSSLETKSAPYFIDGSLPLESLGSASGKASTRHELHAIVRRLRSTKSYMVITVHSEASHSLRLPFSLEWSAPDPRGLFNHLWTVTASSPEAVSAEKRSELFARLSEGATPAPHLLAQAVSLLADCNDVEKVYACIEELSGQVIAQEVTAWFDDEPKLELVAYLTVVAFLGGLSEAALEREYDELCRGLAIGRHKPLDSGQAPPTPGPDRRRRLQIRFLNQPEPRSSSELDRAIDLSSEAYRRAVIGGLWTTWGPDFWKPVSNWIVGLPSRLMDDGDGRADCVARCLTYLADTSYTEVKQTFDGWWGGTRSERVFAFMTASRMAMEDHLASAALTYCLAPFEEKSLQGALRSWTSDVTLGGPLGAAFPEVSIPVLWERGLQQGTGRGPAGLALWQLLTGGHTDHATSTMLLRYVHSQIRQTKRTKRFTPVSCALHILGCRFDLEERRAAAGLRLSEEIASRKVLAAMLRPALLGRQSLARQAASLLTAVIQQSRVRDLQEQVAALLFEITNYGKPDDRNDQRARERLQQRLRQVVRKTLKESKDKRDPVFERFLSERHAPAIARPSRRTRRPERYDG